MAKDSFLQIEYQQCRSAIANFDRILTDLRLKGLALVLAFDGASAITASKVGFLKIGELEVNIAFIIQLISTSLLFPLFYLDKVYTTFLVTTVDRAVAIENKYSQTLEGIPPLSSFIKKKFGKKFRRVGYIHLIIYGILFIASLVLMFIYLTAGVKEG